ncbi:MAG TPA: carboxylesterase family protein [Solirubrobacteraceae bacterium]|nr:carboxylesterase family protein [Solirubrobacteraceae bacterium]
MSTHSRSRHGWTWQRTLLVSAIVALGVLAVVPGGAWAHGRSHAPIAVTRDGVVQGFSAGGVDKFLGIPYAAPPVGALRWRAPQPPAPWHGVRSATTLPPACPQLANSNGPRSENEDCLYLSVYVPQGEGRGDDWARGHARRLPVLFWIHGGGLTTGTGNQHDGTLMATTNHIIVVSINYRLGVFGFMALPSLSAEAPDHASGDYGLLDQIDAMRWTRENIAAFGGDPRNVTIAGESAGAYSICSLLTSPSARGLFARAVMESGSCISTPLATAEQTGTQFATAAGCPTTDPTTSVAACMRSKTAGELLDNPDYPGADSPTWGGAELPADPNTAVAAGHFTRVPLLIGTNHDEGRTFSQGLAGLNEQQYDGLIQSQYGANASKVLAEYPFSAFPSPYTAAYAVGAVWTDSGFIGSIGGCAAQSQEQTFRKYTPVFAYQFDDRNAPGLNDNLPGYMWGAGHAMELAYMWPSFDNGIPLYPQLTPAQLELSNWMVRYWGAFARFGAPFVRGQTFWPPYQSGKMMSLRQGNGSTAISDAEFSAEHNCSFWNSLPAG